MFKKENGFTLIELLIVIVVLGILVSIAVPGLTGVKKRADLAVIKSDLHNIMHSLELYYLDNESYPVQSTASSLSAVAEDLDDLKLKKSAENYQYQTDSASESSGADKYLVYYETEDSKFYYTSTEEASVAGPAETAPAI